MKDKTGGPAFPIVREDREGHLLFWKEGMTLRDYFAGQALVGMLANGGWSASGASKFAYEVADATIEARDKP